MNFPRDGYLYDTNGRDLTLLQSLDVTLENPANSGKKIIIEGYSFINQLNVFMIASLIHMPSTNKPTTVVKPLPYIVGPDISAPDNVGIFKADVKLATSKMGGGTQILKLPIKPGDRNFIESTPLTLMPGTTLGISVSPGVVVTNLTTAIYTREETLSNA